MNIQLIHIAIWTNELEKLRDFYVKYFNGRSNKKYTNPAKGFSSYLVTFDNGVSLEIMQRNDITEKSDRLKTIGITHFAFYTGSVKQVDTMTEQFRKDKYTVTGEPRFTGDGYYESVIEDPDGNQVELVAYPDVMITRPQHLPYELLLLADPEMDMIEKYIYNSDCFVALQNGVVAGVIVVQKQSADKAEIMNLAVDETFQRRGIARKLIQYITGKWAKENNVNKIIIRTGTSAPGPLMLYQQEGFDITAIDFDYFVRTYPEPIRENGVQCKHQIFMEKILI